MVIKSFLLSPDFQVKPSLRPYTNSGEAVSAFLETFYSKSDIDPQWLEYRSHGYPSALAEASSTSFMQRLSPWLRTLLITDGTVTRSLEAYFWEPVKVEQVSLRLVSGLQSIPWLEATKGCKLLLRQVRLVGEHSMTVYTTAFSVVRLDAFSLEVQQQLQSGGIGIGALISEYGLESYRELLDLGYCASLEFEGVGMASALSTDVVFRHYRISVAGKPAILITEKFPLAVYE